MSNTDFEQQLQQRIARLPKEKQPERSLWPGIEYGLQPPAKHQSVPVWRNVAAVLVVGLISWGGLQLSGLQITTADPVQQLARQHQAQKQTLLASFDNQPALADNWQQQLAELESAADAIKQALKEDPNNVALLRMLRNVYQQQIELIEKVHAPKWRQV